MKVVETEGKAFGSGEPEGTRCSEHHGEYLSQFYSVMTVLTDVFCYLQEISVTSLSVYTIVAFFLTEKSCDSLFSVICF